MINPMELKDKNILVTGASSGIGRETAIHLSRLGANVVLIARDEARLKEAYCELEAGNHQYISLDLNCIDKIEEAVDKICNDSFKLDGIVHCAGIQITKPIHILRFHDMNEIMTINYYAFLELVKIFSKKKYGNNGGSIVGISSISSLNGLKGGSVYCGSKGALDSAIRALALELAPRKIRINTVAPGWIETKMYRDFTNTVNSSLAEELQTKQPLGLGQAIDVANAVAFLLSDASRFITGTTLVVDGGYSAQ